MRITECDRCKITWREHSRESTLYCAVDDSTETTSRIAHLCVPCTQELIAWMDGAAQPVDARIGPYHKTQETPDADST